MDKWSFLGKPRIWYLGAQAPWETSRHQTDGHPLREGGIRETGGIPSLLRRERREAFRLYRFVRDGRHSVFTASFTIHHCPKPHPSHVAGDLYQIKAGGAT